MQTENKSYCLLYIIRKMFKQSLDKGNLCNQRRLKQPIIFYSVQKMKVVQDLI